VYFCVGEAAKGPTDKPTRITSLDEFTATYGDIIPAAPNGYNGIDAYFHSGGMVAYYQRLVDPTAVAATGDLATLAGAAAECEASSQGEWGNDLTIDVGPTPGGTKSVPKRSERLTYVEPRAAGAHMATVKLAGVIQATSLPFDTVGELADWLNTTDLVTVGAITNPAAEVTDGSALFTGGDDGAVPVVDTDSLPNALACMPKELGPGQLSAPGKSDLDDQAALLAAGSLTNRVVFLDAARGSDKSALTTAAAALRGALEDRYGALWAPWAVIPGLAAGTVRVVPWSSIQAALCARNDRAGNPNQACAGQWGVADYVQSLDQTFSPDDCEDLLYAGVCTARAVYGQIQAYAFRTLVDPAGPRGDWRELNHARLNMAIVAECDAGGQDYVFSQIDGRGHTIAAFGGMCGGVCMSYYSIDALFGDDPTEAFEVNTSPSVNPPDQLADGIIKAVLGVRMSPHAELVRIEIVKQPITVPLV
jgi:hypothetical protein